MHLPSRITSLVLCALLVASATATGQTVPVRTTDIERKAIYRTIPLTGSVTALRDARLSTATSGLVATLNVDAGSAVQSGDTLLELDSELASLELQVSRARLQQVSSALDDARRRLREAQELVPQKSIAQSTVRDIEAEVALDEAALQQAQAEVGLQQAVLDRHRLHAPFAGVVSAKLTELGEWVTPGQPVLELVATDVVRLDFPVAEDFLPAIAQGGSVRYRLNATPGKDFEGEIATVVPVTDPNARTFLLRVHPGAGRDHLQPGMSVTASLKLSAGREGLVVPRDALLRYPDGRTVVWTLQEKRGELAAVESLVRTGLQFDGLIEITGAVSEGDQVVVEGNEALRDGQRVTVRAAIANSGRDR